MLESVDVNVSQPSPGPLGKWRVRQSGHEVGLQVAGAEAPGVRFEEAYRLLCSSRCCHPSPTLLRASVSGCEGAVELLWLNVPVVGMGHVLPFRAYRYFQALILILPSVILLVVLVVRIR